MDDFLGCDPGLLDCFFSFAGGLGKDLVLR
jgi:hypothetical protein